MLSTMLIKISILILKLLAVDFASATYNKDPLGPTVKTKIGIIRGVQASDGDYNMFMGIPYARVNMTNPFGDSLPYPKFQEIFEANNDSAECTQVHSIHGLGGSLDCLQLNIYVPNNDPTDLPVMVYIFGGGFIQGSFTRKYYGPRFLMKYGVILVIMNYRVRSYGTLCLETPEASGNQAFKDQRSALKWIQKNIREFGGDPGKVTLIGHSGGAVSVSLQLLYAKEELFHQAIIASGTAFYPRTESNPSNDLILKLSKYFGFETNDVKKAHHFISTVEPSKVVQAETQIGYKCLPCLETKFENTTNFIDEHVKNMKIKNNAAIPILIGNSGDESYYLFDKEDPIYFKENDLIYNTLKTVFTFNDKDFNTAYELVNLYYMDGNETKVTKRKYIDFFSDFFLVYPNKIYANKFLEKGTKIYYYVFPYCGGRNFMKNQKNLSNSLATHGDELGYIFDISFPYMNKDREEDNAVRHNFLTMLANFAKYGDPTPVPTNQLPKWKPITNDTWYYMNIDSELSLREAPFKQQIAFWDHFYELFGHLENNLWHKQKQHHTEL